LVAVLGWQALDRVALDISSALDEELDVVVSEIFVDAWFRARIVRRTVVGRGTGIRRRIYRINYGPRFAFAHLASVIVRPKAVLTRLRTDRFRAVVVRPPVQPLHYPHPVVFPPRWTRRYEEESDRQ